MKKVLWLIVCLMTMVFSSCTTHKYIASAEYEVCYPDGTQKFNESVTLMSAGEPSVACYSVGGTNYVAVVTNCQFDKAPKILFRSSTAPIRLKTYNVTRAKKQIKNINGKTYVYQ